MTGSRGGARPPAPTGTLGTGGPGRTGAPRVLVVDDSLAHLELVVPWLTEAGFSVHATLDPLDALGRFGREPFDLVLTDLEMPGMDGNTLARRLRALDGAVPVVAVTGAPHRAEATFDHVVAKPYGPDTLLAVVRWTVEASRRVPEAALGAGGAP